MQNPNTKKLIEQLKALDKEEFQEALTELMQYHSKKYAEKRYIEFANGSKIQIPDDKVNEHLGMRGKDTRIFEEFSSKYKPKLHLTEEQKKSIKKAIEEAKLGLKDIWEKEFNQGFSEAKPIDIKKELKERRIWGERINEVIQDINKKYPSFATPILLSEYKEEHITTFYIYFDKIKEPYIFKALSPAY